MTAPVLVKGCGRDAPNARLRERRFLGSRKNGTSLRVAVRPREGAVSSGWRYGLITFWHEMRPIHANSVHADMVGGESISLLNGKRYAEVPRTKCPHHQSRGRF